MALPMCSKHMEQLNTENVATVSNFLKGKRLEKFTASVEMLNASIKAEGWLPRGYQKATSGFYQGLISKITDTKKNEDFDVYMVLSYGQGREVEATDEQLTAMCPKVPVEVSRAWLALCAEKGAAVKELEASRPLPVYTEIGLSRKVTQTLEDANINLDLTTRRLCPLDWRWVDATDTKGHVILDRRTNTPVQVKEYFPNWPEDTKFGTSRFRHCDCEACGKTIPSRQFVPVLVDNAEGVPHGFWFGRDCAKNILGIKDAGIKKPESK